MLRFVLTAAALAMAAPVAAQEPEVAPIQQRTVENANKFLDLLTKESGSLLKFHVRGTDAQVEVVEASTAQPCVTRLKLVPSSLAWASYPPAAPGYKAPEFVDLNWDRMAELERGGHSTFERDGRAGKTLWGIKLGLAPPTTLETGGRYVYWVFRIPPEMQTRVLAAGEFLREKCQFQSNTGF